MSRWLRTAEKIDIIKLAEQWKKLQELLYTNDQVPGIQVLLSESPTLNNMSSNSEIPNDHDETAYKEVLNTVYNKLNELDEKYPEYHEIYNQLMDIATIPSIQNLN